MHECSFCGDTFENAAGKGNHENWCDENPERLSGEKWRKYERTTKTCPVCGKEFETQIGSSDERKTCSYSCSNKLFRSGPNNGNWSEDRYRTTCILYHDKECLICGEDKIVEVHHVDEDRSNNKPENLVPLCPTHHKYMHSEYRHLIESDVEDYLERFMA